MEGSVGQAPLSAVVVLTSATRELLELIAIEPVASAAGSSVVPPAPAPSLTRKYPPAGMLHGPLAHRGVGVQVLEVLDQYWTDQFVISTAEVPLLWSSI